MQDAEPRDFFLTSLERWDDGSVVLVARFADQYGQMHDELWRSYRPGVDLGQAVDDAARLMCGWAAWGALGFHEANDHLAHF